MHKFDFSPKNLKIIEKYNCLGNLNILIYDAATVNNPKDHSIIFTKVISTAVLEKLGKFDNSLLILPETTDISLLDKYGIIDKCFIILSKNPRLDYAKILSEAISKKDLSFNKEYHHFDLENGIIIGKNVSIGHNVLIEPFVLVENDTFIGDNTIIKTGTKIRRFTEIGNNVVIGENVVIGAQGFGVERDSDDKLYRIPHIGGVRIDDYTEIGANSSIASGTIEPTYIGKNVIIDTSVHVAHNVYINDGVLIAGGAVISGSVLIGKNTWIGPGAIISNKITIGDNTFVCLGSVVIKNISDNEKVSGNFAMRHEDFMRLQAKQRLSFIKDKNASKK